MSKRKKPGFLRVRTRIVRGLKCQGNKESNFVNECYRKGIKVKKAPRIETPYGHYTPDFEIEDKYIEIKSKGTFEVCIGLTTYIKGPTAPEMSDLQYKKIIWVASHVKPVEIRVYLSKSQYKEEYNLPKEKNLIIKQLGGRTRKRPKKMVLL